MQQWRRKVATVSQPSEQGGFIVEAGDSVEYKIHDIVGNMMGQWRWWQRVEI